MICSILGIPTSSDDLVAVVAGASPIKSAYDLAKHIYGNFGGPLAYLGTMLGRTLGRLWLLVGIPVFVLDVILAADYLPPWIVAIGLTEWSLSGLLLLGYVLSYVIGALVPAPQKRFNQARLIYERQVIHHGYWFDCFRERSFDYNRRKLERARSIFREIEKALAVTPVNTALLQQRQMVLAYQSALLLASQQSYGEALKAVRRAHAWREKLKDSSIWKPGEYDTTRSQMLFLEGELLYVEGDTDSARERFKEALTIDTRVNDRQGIEVIKRRLSVLNETANNRLHRARFARR